ncbi:MAG: flagellar hook-basal body protein [Alphaproteobacteria bacterium]
MDNTSYIALSNQIALQDKLSVIAGNIANVNTPAYKGEHSLFAEHLPQPPSPEDKASFVLKTGTYRDQSMGAFTQTGNPLDFSLQGDGFFKVETADNNASYYTRNGSFSRNAEGFLVNQEGLRVIGGGEGETNASSFIQIPPHISDLIVAKDGSIRDNKGAFLGQINVTHLENSDALERHGSDLYAFAPGTKPIYKEDITEIRQGMLEMSNVNPIVETTKMMEVYRNFQAINNVVKNEHERELQAIRALDITQN